MELFTFPINNLSPINEQIYIQIKNLITNNKFSGDKQLPSPRELAIHLKQSQSDIFDAYTQLSIEGYIEKKDDIFFVRQLENTEKISPGYTSEFIKHKRILPYDFKIDLVDKQHFPLKQWQRSLLEASEDLTIYSASEGSGDPLLKDALKNHLKDYRGIEVSTSNIFINSSIRAIMIRLGVFFREKGYFNSYISENPGKKITYNLFNSIGFKTTTFPVTPDGHEIESIPEEQKILLVSPSQQQLYGITMPIEKRLRLISWAERTESLIIEDESESDFRYYGKVVEPLAATNSEHVIYVGSFSHSFLPTLRVSYLIIPDRFVEEFSNYNAEFEQNSSTLNQLAIAKFINKGFFIEHLEKMTSIYEQKMTVLLTKIETTLPATVKVYSYSGGQYIVIQPNNNMTEDELISTAEKMGVGVYRGSNFFIENHSPSSPIVLLGFGKLSRKEFISGIERLYQAWFTN